MEANTTVDVPPGAQPAEAATWTKERIVQGLQELAEAQRQAEVRRAEDAAERRREREKSDEILRLLQEQLQRMSGPAALPSEEPDNRGTSASPEAPFDDGALRRKPLPDPAKFSGDKDEYGVWEAQMRDKLVIDAPFYRTDEERRYLVFSCLAPRVQKVVSQFYREGGKDGKRGSDELLAYLSQAYSDPHQARNALNELSTMTMRKGEKFAAFLPRFEKTLANAGGWKWPADVTIQYLTRALAPRLREHMIAAPQDKSSYTGFLHSVQAVAGNMEGYDFDQRHPWIPVQKGYRATKERVDSDGDTTMTGAVRAAKPEQEAKPSARPETRRCFNCDKIGHIARNCKQKRGARVAQAAPAEETNSDDDEYHSGKE